MLRAKQISSNLSSGAKSFLLNGSRCAADCNSNSNSNSNSEDEISRTQFAKSNLVVVNSHKGQTFTHVVEKPNSVNYAVNVNVVEKNGGRGSIPITDQVVKVGIVAAGFLSDIVNYKIPGSDESSGLVTTNCVIDPIKPVSSFRSSNVKPIKVYPKSVASGSTDNSNKSTFVRGFKQESDIGGRNLPAFEKKSVPVQRSTVNSNRATSNFSCNVGSSVSKNEYVAGSFSCYNARSSVSKNEYVAGSVEKPLTGVTLRQHTGSRNVVENASNILRQVFKWCPAAEAALGNLNCFIDPFQANQVLKQIQDYSVALEFFFWLKRQPRFKHDGHTYTTMVGILGRAKQFGAINKLLDEMVIDGCQPNVVTYNRIIHSYGRANYLSEAINVFNQMQESGCEPDRVTYCTLIDSHAKAGFLDVAMDMYRRMQAAGLSPDTFTYSVMINCLGKAGHLPAAQKLFFEMIDHGCEPNLVTYNIMIALQAKARNYQSALKIYRDMKIAGFKPDKVTYSIVMEVLGHCGYLDEAESVFTEMKQNNWVPDEPVYGLLVNLWGKAGKVDKAWQWYQAMLNGGLYPNIPTCNSLLCAFLRVHRLPDAYNLLQSMRGFGLNPSLQTYTLLLSCCTEARSLYDMGFCRELMSISGHPAHFFLLSMPASGPDGENVRDHVSKFLDLMHSEDRESKRGLIDAVVDFLHKSGLKEEAGSVWEVAARKNVYPDAVREKSSCYWLINLHVMSDGTAVTALSRTLAWIRREMLVSGISPSRIDIVTGWGRRSRVTGTSLVRQAVQELLSIFNFPFFTENGNSGCFVGSGEPLSRWLLPSYVERMHLL